MRFSHRSRCIRLDRMAPTQRALRCTNGGRKRKARGDRGLSFSLAIEIFLERAKGFEPSTPTLARSCSTTELHPHPRDWRRTTPATGRAMPNAARECNSRSGVQRARYFALAPRIDRFGSQSRRSAPKCVQNGLDRENRRFGRNRRAPRRVPPDCKIRFPAPFKSLAVIEPAHHRDNWDIRRGTRDDTGTRRRNGTAGGV
jgi:hypothetical protein